MGWAAETLDRNRLMVGTGTPALAETISLTIHADDLGYPVALVLPPYYYTPPSDNGLIAWYLSLYEALGDRPIKVWFYNFPQMTGFVIPERVIELLHREDPDRFNGIKDSSGDLSYCRRLVDAMPELQVFPSSETSLAEGRSQGFAGCISATVNHSASLCQKVWQGDVSPVDEITELRSAISERPLIPSVKYMVAKHTAQTDWVNVLPPLTELSAAQMAALDLFA